MRTLEEVADFHGHVCPGLAIGYRVALCALKELGEPARDEELVAVVENDSCAVDAVQVMTGCTFGKGNLVHRDHGKQVYTFLRRPSGQGLRIAVNWTPPPERPEETAAWEAYRGGDRSEDVLRLVHERKSRKLRAVLEAPDDELLSVTRGPVELPPVARIHPSVTCAACGEKVMEPRARLRDGKVLCLPCSEAPPAEAGP